MPYLRSTNTGGKHWDWDAAGGNRRDDIAPANSEPAERRYVRPVRVIRQREQERNRVIAEPKPEPQALSARSELYDLRCVKGSTRWRPTSCGWSTGLV